AQDERPLLGSLEQRLWIAADRPPGVADELAGGRRRDDQDAVAAAAQLLGDPPNVFPNLVGGLPGERGDLRDREPLRHALRIVRPATWPSSRPCSPAPACRPACARTCR